MGSAIRLLRRRADLTQGQLGNASGVHRGLIASIEAGRKANPGVRTIVRIASGIDARPEQLSDLVAHVTRVFVGEVTIDELRGYFLVEPLRRRVG
jgi:transcriptional regulator with XRE-family HTH domain